jgi:NADH-quinone oxidoreductase subunit I
VPTEGRWGLITLDAAACTACLVCVRECPDWCITLESHQEVDDTAGRRARTRDVLDRFEIDFGACLYCGICVETCPFDALHWAPEADYPAAVPEGLVHGIDRLGPVSGS